MNVTPCFRTFDRALRLSHSNTGAYYPQNNAYPDGGLPTQADMRMIRQESCRHKLTWRGQSVRCVPRAQGDVDSCSVSIQLKDEFSRPCPRAEG